MQTSEFAFVCLFLAGCAGLSIAIDWLITKLRIRERLGLARKDDECKTQR